MQYRSQFVLTTKQIADSYGCSADNIRWNFAKNQDKFIEGVHYFKLEGEELKEFKAYFAELAAQKKDSENFRPADLPFTKMASSLYLWTLQGAARHCKMLGTQKAWDVFTILENSYFGKSKLQDSIPPLELNLSPLDKFNFEKAKLLIRAAEMTDDKNLRDALIKSALELLD